MTDKTNSYVFTEQELKDINDMRKGYEEMPDRDKFLVKEALKPYFYGKKTEK
jgi:hypothetical protein